MNFDAFDLKRSVPPTSNIFYASDLKRSAPPTSNPTRRGNKMLRKFDLFHLGLIFLIVVFFIMFPFPVASAKWSLTPRFYVEGMYDDNIFLTERHEKDDFITTISPGVNLSYEAPTGEINLDYEYRRSFYDDFPELDFSAHRGRAEARKDFAPWFGAEVRETFIRSQDPIELTGLEEFERPSIRIGMRNRYIRNIVEPEATFRFGENRSIRFGYRNNILRNKAIDIADQDENAANALLIFRFNISNGIEVFYEHINQEYQKTVPPSVDEDFDGDEIRGRYTHYFNPRVSAFIEHRYYQRNFDRKSAGVVDYVVHDPSGGIVLEPYENMRLSAQAGYAVRDAEGRKDEGAFSGRGDLSASYKHLTVSLYGESGFDEDYLSAERLGFNEFWRAGFSGRYDLLERLWAEGFFYIGRDRFVDIDRGDSLWSARGSLNYGILRWLFLSFDYEHNVRDSNIPLESFRDNRYFGRITAQYDIAERFQ